MASDGGIESETRGERDGPALVQESSRAQPHRETRCIGPSGELGEVWERGEQPEPVVEVPQGMRNTFDVGCPFGCQHLFESGGTVCRRLYVDAGGSGRCKGESRIQATAEKETQPRSSVMQGPELIDKSTPASLCGDVDSIQILVHDIGPDTVDNDRRVARWPDPDLVVRRRASDAGERGTSAQVVPQRQPLEFADIVGTLDNDLPSRKR